MLAASSVEEEAEAGFGSGDRRSVKFRKKLCKRTRSRVRKVGMCRLKVGIAAAGPNDNGTKAAPLTG